MKRKYFFKNTGRGILVVGLLATTLLSSCLKDTSPGTLNLGTSPALLGFQYQGFAFSPYVAAIFGKPNDSVDVKVTLSVASITLGSAVTCSLVDDPQVVTDYNTANGTNYVALPTSKYTLPNGGKVTIPAGTQYATIKVSINGPNVDFSQANAIGLKITNSSGPIIASNLNTAIVTITLKSIYAGTYHNFGFRVHPVLGTFNFDYSVAMGTVDQTTIEGNALADLGADLVLHVNPDNTVDVTSPNGQPSAADSPGLVNSYDPATKTFTLHYFYNTSAPRKMTQTMVYTGP